MEEPKKKCERPGCDHEFTINRFHPNQKFCSERCARKVRDKKRNLAGFPSPKPDDDEPPIKRQTIPTSVTANTDILTKTIIDFKDKEITRMETAYNEERSKRKKLKAENEALRTELAELKTEQRIAAIEEKKPTGLAGILPGGIEGLLNNPYIGPVIGSLVQSLVPQPGALAGGNTQQSAANGFILWFDQQTDDVKQNFAELVDGLSKADPATLGDTIKRMVALLNAGSTIGNPNPSSFKQTAAYGY